MLLLPNLNPAIRNASLLFAPDNTHDIGASGATRPRTGYFGTSLIIGGNSSPALALEVVSTAAQQRLAYTAGSVYTDLQTLSSGRFSILPTGGRVGINTGTIGAALEVVSTALGQLRASYTANTVYAEFLCDSSGDLRIVTTGPRSIFYQNLVYDTDNAYDIGASGATRPRTGYFGTSINVVSGAVLLDTNGITIGDAKNIIVNATTGTKIGTASTQKIGIWNATPIVQPSSTGEASGFTVGAGTTVRDDSTFTGNVGSTAYRISDIVKHLKNIGLIAP